MLRRLEIRNFAVISHCVFEPDFGLNVISGETGAGKSLLIDAIGLILGDKASKSLIRTNSDKAYVEALFDYSLINSNVVDKIRNSLESSGIDFDEDNLIVTREISSDGRSVARINGRTVVLSVLKEVASLLIDIHGQNDTQQIFDDSTHVSLVDGFIGKEAFDLLKEYRTTLSKYKDIVLSIKKLGTSPEQRKIKREYYCHAIEEISKANFKPGEEEALHESKKKLSNVAKVSKVLEQINDLLNGGESSGNSKVKMAQGLLNKISNASDEYMSWNSRLESISLDLDALSSELNEEYLRMDSSDSKLDEINSRISLLFDLKTKYGNSIEDINRFLDEAKKNVEEIDGTSERLVELKNQRSVVEAELLSVSKKLSDLRHSKASVLSEKIVKELVDLEMPSSRFIVDFKEHSKDKYFSSVGTEDITFSFSANPGESPKPLSRIVSGGEASRIMLAIKTILSEVDNTATLVFDEIDTGISGIASLKVAEKLRLISANHQVLSVSHTAQIAAAAKENFFIHKNISDDSSSTEIAHLDFDGKLNEVSRLLSGTNDSQSLDLAKSLIVRFD